MATTAQNIFKKIVLHNKIMTEATVDRLLVQMPDPQAAVKFLVKKEKLSANKAKQLLTLYEKQLEKQAGGSGSSVLQSDEPTQKPTPDESFAAMFDEILSDSSASSSIKAGSSAVRETTAHKTQTDSATTAAEPSAAATPSASASVIDVDETEVKTVSRSADDLPMLELDTDDDEADESPAAAAQATPAAPAAKATTVEREMPAAAPKAVQAAGPVDPLVKKIFTQARKSNASDVHIKSNERPLMRVAGSLREIEGFEAIPDDKCREGLLTLLDSHQREHFIKTGDLDFCYDGGEQLGRFRSNMMNQHRGTDGIFRLIPNKPSSFEDLGLPETIRRFTEYKQGIVLITGPKGSGKTTTLAAMVDLINTTRPEHIITIEDPIEFVHPCKKGHVNQREVGPHTETFSAALRAALREAPDVIMVGEMRDLETTSLAITAAETGHLVFGTLHTPDAVRTIDRVLDVFPPKEQGQIRSMLSESLRGIVSQLLVPSVDGNSQVLALEIMVNTSAIGNLVRESKTFQLRGIMQTGKRLGMILMDDSLARLVKEGKIKKEDALAVASDRKQLALLLG